MKTLKIILIVACMFVNPLLWAEDCPPGSSFEAPVTLNAKFLTLDVTSALKGTYSYACGNLRFDFHADDSSFPSDVSVIAAVGAQKMYVVSHASKSYFQQALTPASVGQLHELAIPFSAIFSDPSKRQAVGEKEIHGEKCKEYKFEAEEGQGKVCLSNKHPDRPLQITAQLEDGSLLTQEMGPYQQKEIALSRFQPPSGYKAEDYSVNDLLTIFLKEPPSFSNGFSVPLPVPSQR